MTLFAVLMDSGADEVTRPGTIYRPLLPTTMANYSWRGRRRNTHCHIVTMRATRWYQAPQSLISISFLSLIGKVIHAVFLWLKVANKHRVALSWISIVGCLLSLLGILITLLAMFYFWKNLRSPRTIVLINLCVAIAVTDILTVAMEIADVQNQVRWKLVFLR